MATFEALRAAVLPRARWLAGDPGAARDGHAARGAPGTRELAWVRLMRARVPAFDALDPGDLGIVPVSALAIVAPDDEAIATLVRAAADAGIGGIVLVEDPSGPSPAPMIAAVADAASSIGLAVLAAGPGDPAQVERSAIGFLVNHRAELDRQATILESRLEGVALAGGGPEEMAAAIAGFLGRAIAIEGRRGTRLAVHAPAGVPDAAAAVAAYHHRRRSAAARIPLPLPTAATAGLAEDPASASGSLVLLGERPPSELERVATARVAGLLVLELVREEAVGRAVDTARREPLPADGPPWVVLVARQAVGDATATGEGAAAGSGSAGRPSGPSDAASREALRRDLRALAPARRMALRGDVQSIELRAVVAAPPDDPEAMDLARRIAAFLGRLVAVSRPFSEARDRSAAEADARATMEAAERLAEPPAVARADRLPAYRLVGNLHNLPDGERQARALLEPLLRGRADVRRERLATLRAVLEQPGIAEAADALGVHRNTVAYRIRAIEAATGWRLADPELRFPLALALRLVQDA
ncbi:MAG TPA: helix-turn-helix domain-containing protein [Candidatus Limnocylindrales bacterium]